ncbi:50S ribosomal protein L13 [Lyticum sinuosum]|uniref:Large ribosomal subunit protein uL13 n=1 Tax=Lyticum sinuosum TaxID=1332059 RepID=A0AAE4VL41_9RICK|nr:50S ribosomal protein L13 [Lyticum sinuosum]
MANPKHIVRNSVVVDISGISLGRAAARIALLLRGKHKPYYTPHQDCGDFVIIINANDVKITGNKLKNRVYHWHTGYPGGIKSRSWDKMTRERVIETAIKRMMPKDSPLSRKQFARLRIYPGEKHQHQGQNPVLYKVNTHSHGIFTESCQMTGCDRSFGMKGFSVSASQNT